RVLCPCAQGDHLPGRLMDYSGRLSRAIDLLDGEEVDGLLVTDLINVRYLTGFSGTAGTVLVHRSGATFFTDGRYKARAAELVRDAEIAIYRERLVELLPQALTERGVSTLGFESEVLTVAEHADLERDLGINLKATKGVVGGLRRTKEPTELAAIREAVRLGDEAFERVVERLKPGDTERETALFLEVTMREAGADDVSFPPIVGSGPHAGHIHHTPTQREFRSGELVLLDFGARVDGYCSDLTRTVMLGPGSDELRERYRLVLAAQEAGIASIAPGAQCRAVDASARNVIETAGHGDLFAHGLGHGVGLDIHEAPRFNRESEQSLLEGDVVTVEPGIYDPTWGGIRIEDCVHVSATGADVLSKSPKHELIEV
ncbi:MAG TPA: Xaa-Pro peptidase family protein, partial [Actinomycetota bacterium]|nr:Xaa-Pro peptidase family protein [Actinomycetota bacterium]